jgi:hypothetical protein
MSTAVVAPINGSLPADASILSLHGPPSSSNEGGEITLPPVDEALRTMDRLLLQSKILPHTTVAEAAHSFWADAAFYEKWLTHRENSDIQVGAWEEATGVGQPALAYKGETFDKKRVVTFTSPRTLSLISNASKEPTTVAVLVRETQYLRLEEDSVTVVTAVQQSNVSFGEAFLVHWRWVGSDLKKSPQNVLVRVGFSIHFVVDVWMADKLRRQQAEFSLQRHSHLFRFMKQDLMARQLPLALVDPWLKMTTVLRLFFPFWLHPKTIRTVPSMIEKVKEQVRLVELLAVPQGETSKLVKLNLEQLKLAQDSLKILVEKEQDWVISSTVPKEEASGGGDDPRPKDVNASTEELPPFLAPIAKAIKNLQVINPWEKNVMKTVLSDSEATMMTVPFNDPVMEKMTMMVSRTVFQCSSTDVMNFITNSATGWYENWLSETGRSQVDVPAWTEEAVTDDYSGETFSYSRTVTSRFDKSTYTTKNDPSSSVVLAVQKQAQYCRVDAQSSSVVWSTTTTVEGMPFADSWRVHVRWVISPVEDEAVLIEIGYAIEVLKPFMMESLLRSKAMIRVRDRQIHLLRVFRTVLKAEIEARNRKHPMVEAVETSVHDATDRVRRWVRLYPEHMLRDDPTWQLVFMDMRKKLKGLEQTLRFADKVENVSRLVHDAAQDEARYVLQELEHIRGVLEGIVVTLGDPEETVHALDEACFSP